MSELLYEKKGNIAVFTMNNPDKLNVITPTLLFEMRDAMYDYMEDTELYCGIITGAGEKSFCAGADIKEYMPFVKSTLDTPWKFPDTIMRGLYVTKPLIAAVNGYAYGGGGEIALACDLRIASENATFRWPEASLGIIPRLGGTQRLPRLVGYGRAMEILMTNEKVDANEALRIGLVNKVVPKEELMTAAFEMAERIASLAPLSIQGIKKSMYYGTEMPLADGLTLENDICKKLYSTEDHQEARQAFIEKRKPEYKGR